MGADLYMGGFTVGESGGQDYFRDSYNGTSVLWTLGLSWWADVDKKLCDKEGELKGEKLIQFRDMVVNATQTFPDANKLKELGCAIAETGEDSVESWQKYYANKRQRLIDFLNRAIDNKSFIACSL